MRAVEAYKRWRHTHGFGVHSPFAFDLVTTVVRPGSCYAHYGYEDIDNSIVRTSLPDSRRHARMLLRLAAFLDVRSAFLPKDAYSPPFRAALRAANSGMWLTSAMAEIHKCQLVCTTADFVPLHTLCEFLKHSGAIISIRALPEDWCRTLFDALPEGLMLYSKDAAIMVNRPGMQKISYSIRL